MRPIIFDTDPGIDDAMALLFAAASPAIELVGVTTTFGNATIEQTTRNALLMESRFALGCPVHRGAAAPLVGKADAPPTFVHGMDGLGDAGYVAPDIEAGDDAARFIVDAVRARPGEITIVAVGRQTNLARALAIDPGIADLVRGVFVMGGALGRTGVHGNVTPCAEANIFGDAHAADRVLTAHWPVTLVPLDVTMRTRMGPELVEAVRRTAGEAGEFIANIVPYYRNFYESRGEGPAFPVHDSSAVAALLMPELYTQEAGALRVVTGGIAHGQTLFSRGSGHYVLDDWGGLPEQTVCVDVRGDAVLDFWLETLRS